MKRLLLLRHAKSSWDDPDLDDHDRPLAPRGRRAAVAMARRLAELRLLPDLVLCSTARRAADTWARVQPHLGVDPPVLRERGLYAATPAALCRRLQAVDDSVDAVLLVGHEPALSQLACTLAGPDGSRARRRLERKFPTGACAEIRFAVDRWREIAPGGGELARFLRPRDLV